MSALQYPTEKTRWKKLPDQKEISIIESARTKCVRTTIVSKREILEVQLVCGHWVRANGQKRERITCPVCAETERLQRKQKRLQSAT